MANYNDLKTAIQQVIKTNGNKEITAALLQQSLLSMINSLGVGYQFMSVATPSTSPGTPDQKVFYIATSPGKYVNFSNIVVNNGEIAILKYDSTWSKESFSLESRSSFSIIGADISLQRNYLFGCVPGDWLYILTESQNWSPYTNLVKFIFAYFDTNGTRKEIFTEPSEETIPERMVQIPSDIGLDGKVEISIRAAAGNVVNVLVEKITSLTQGIFGRLIDHHTGGITDDGGMNNYNIRHTLCVYNVEIGQTYNIRALPGYMFIWAIYSDCACSSTFLRINSGNFNNLASIQIPENSKMVALTVAKVSNETITAKEALGSIIFAKNEENDVADVQFVNSQVFKTCKLAWYDKLRKYECWPFGGVIASGNTIIAIYNSRSKHIEKTDSDVLIRKKTTLGPWYYRGTIIAHDANYSYGNPVCCLSPGGNIIAIVCCTNSTFTNDTHYFKMFVSSDGGATWEDNGFVKVNGENVVEECMMSLFLTSTGKLISFVGGIYGGRFIVSDDLGETWRYVGDDLGTNKLEAGFFEGENGDIYAIVRENMNTPALYRLPAALDQYEQLFNFGSFNFPAWYNPTSVSKLPNGKFLLLGASRTQDENGKYQLFEAIATEDEIVANNIISRAILKFPAAHISDWGYAQTAVAEDGNIYGYIYAGKTNGYTEWYELIGC